MAKIIYKTKFKAYEDGLGQILAGDTGIDPVLEETPNGCTFRFNFPYGGYGADRAMVVLEATEQAKVYPDDPFKVKVRLKSLHLPEYNLTEDAGCDDIFADQIIRWTNRIYSILQFNPTYEFEIGDPEK
jgi:hypothetical protein